MDPTCRDLQAFRKAILRKREWLQKFFVEHLTWMDWSGFFSVAWILLVIVDNLDAVGIRPDPAKTDPPRIVHPNAVRSNRRKD